MAVLLSACLIESLLIIAAFLLVLPLVLDGTGVTDYVTSY